MKKLLLTFLGFGLASHVSQAQCSATSPSSFMDCNYYQDRINAFSLNSISATGNAGCGSNGYNLFSSPVWTLNMGNTYNWTCSTGNWYYNGMGIWIDWNNDGQYVSSEMVAAKSYAFNHSGSFPVPYTAVVGTNLRMRVRCCQYYPFSSSTSACSSLYGYGETEDYYVYIACPASLPAPTVAATSTYICAGQSVTLTATGGQNYTITGGAGGVTNGVGFAPTASAIYTITSGITACPSVTNSTQRTISVTSTPLNITAIAGPTVVCAGQPATLTAVGANNFTWSPGNIVGGNVTVGPTATTIYTVLGYNGVNTGCPGTKTVALTVNPLPTITAVGSSFSVCPGKSATLTATGAQGYTWTPGGSTNSSIVVTPSVSTGYNVTGTNSFGCSSSAATVVILATAPNIQAFASKPLICAGSNVTLTGTGANTYTWVNETPGSNPIVVSPSVSTTYSVIGLNTTTGCDKMTTVQVNVFEPITTISSNTSVCLGSEVTLAATGGNSYSWTPGGPGANLTITPTVSAMYQVTINSFSVINCQTIKSVSVTVNSLPDVKAVASRTSICRFESMELSVSGAVNYTWANGATQPSIVLTPSVSSVQFFVVKGEDANNCAGYDTLLLRVNSCTALQELNAGSKVFSVYPNPSTGNFKVFGVKDQKLTLVNELGDVIRNIHLTAENHLEVSVEGLATGIYFLVGGEGELNVTKKIVVTK